MVWQLRVRPDVGEAVRGAVGQRDTSAPGASTNEGIFGNPACVMSEACSMSERQQWHHTSSSSAGSSAGMLLTTFNCHCTPQPSLGLLRCDVGRRRRGGLATTTLLDHCCQGVSAVVLHTNYNGAAATLCGRRDSSVIRVDSWSARGAAQNACIVRLTQRTRAPFPTQLR